MPDRLDQLERAIQAVLELCDHADRLRAGKTGRDAKALEVFADEVRSRITEALGPPWGEAHQSTFLRPTHIESTPLDRVGV